MRFIIAFSFFAFGIGHSMAVEKPKDTPPKEQWIEITKPVIGCFSIGSDLVNTPKLIPAIESEKVISEKRFECSMMQIGDKYIYDKPVLGYTTLISVICEHCAPYAYPVYTKAKAGFYKLIPTPVSPPSVASGAPFNGQHVPLDQLMKSAASAGEKIYYGKWAGELATIKIASGLNTSEAMIIVTITEEDATEYCNSGHIPAPPTCVKYMVTRPFPDYVYANCKTGDFMDFERRHYRFEGAYVPKAGETFETLKGLGYPKWNIRERSTHEILDGSHGAGYEVKIGIFKALCPASVHGEDYL